MHISSYMLPDIVQVNPAMPIILFQDLMGQLDQESDVQDLCAIRKPAVWHRDELHSASLKDHLDESRDILECSY